MPARGYELRMIPAGAAAPPAVRRPAHAARPGPRRAAADRGDPVRRRGRRGRRLRRLRGAARLPGSSPDADPARGARGERPPGAGQPARRAAHPARRRGRRGQPAAGAVRIGIPLRRTHRHAGPRRRRGEARAALGLDPERPVLLVFGGSQGAQRINAARRRGAARPARPGPPGPARRRSDEHRGRHRTRARLPPCRPTWTGWTWPMRRRTWW